MITASMATIPSRSNILKQCVDSLIDQVDKLIVAFNYRDTPIPNWVKDYEKIKPLLLDNYLGDAAKFLGLKDVEGYVLICDDDIIYPPDYSKTMIAKVDQHNSVVSCCGSKIKGKIESYYKDRYLVASAFTKRQCKKDTLVNICGTGIMAYDAEKIQVPVSIFERPNMADIFFGKYCNNKKIDIVCISKKHGWLKEIDGRQFRKSIYSNRSEHDTIQTAECNKISWRQL